MHIQNKIPRINCEYSNREIIIHKNYSNNYNIRILSKPKNVKFYSVSLEMQIFMTNFNIMLKSYYSIGFEYSKKMIKIFNDRMKIVPKKFKFSKI